MDEKAKAKLIADLRSGLKSRFSMDDVTLDKATSIGKDTLSNILKQFVMKNGTKEIEQILLGQKTFKDSDLRKEGSTALIGSLKAEPSMKDSADELGNYALDTLVGSLKNSYDDSANTRDLDGICKFLGIDRNLIKMVNSPVGKLFGKFIK